MRITSCRQMLLAAAWAVSAHAEPIDVLPATAADVARSLNGEWSFKYVPSLEAGADRYFHEPRFDVSEWEKIPVPANWELQGFAEPRYDTDLKDGSGLYRRTFRIPANWRGDGRVCLRFEGVAYGFEAWINGKMVGESVASAYNPHTFDITDALSSDAGAENVLAVQVITKPKGYALDLHDDWSLSGIFRDVNVFFVPAIHVRDLATSTDLKKDGAAELMVEVAVNERGAEIHGRLIAPDGGVVEQFHLSPQPEGNLHKAVVAVSKPELWTAETPSLYRLKLALVAEGKTLQTLEKRIGLREVSIDDNQLLLNGRPIKLRGVNHHDLDPKTGRAINEEQMRHDLELMKKGNINFVRTAHYPTHPRFLELCDDLGFYVISEVSMSSRDSKLLRDSGFRKNILARTEATVTRDKNHSSVILWSIGNENGMNDAELEAGRYAKELDPTRPICIPKQFVTFNRSRHDIPEYVDILAPHYPSTSYLKSWTTMLKRPTILTEYAHAQGLAADRIDSQWGIIQETPHFAGGAIWHFHDQGILRKSEEPVDPENYTTDAWPDANHYYDTHDGDGSDGIVYADRTPQPDFWQVRKVYSPVQIAEGSADVAPGQREIHVTVENRHDFRALDGMNLAWELQRNGESIQNGEEPLSAPSREQETVKIPVAVPTDAAGDVLALALRCIDENGRQITERVLRLDVAGTRRDAWLDHLKAWEKPKVTESNDEVKVEHANFVISVQRPGGELTIRDRGGRTLVAGIYPHPGRMRLMVERRDGDESRFDFWPVSKLTSSQDSGIKVAEQGSSVRLTVSGRYPRPNKSEQALVGGYEVEVASSGALKVSYCYAPSEGAEGKFAEAGLSMVLPPEMTEFRWIGDGPYAGYPGKDRLNEFGIFHLNREDLRFQGNRRGTETALLTTVKGAGVALITSAADVSVERHEDHTLLSHNAVISSLGNKTSDNPPEKTVDVKDTDEIVGSFTLVPLAGKWPEVLTRRFGKPDAAENVFRPFYHSYDQ